MYRQNQLFLFLAWRTGHVTRLGTLHFILDPLSHGLGCSGDTAGLTCQDCDCWPLMVSSVMLERPGHKQIQSPPGPEPTPAPSG